jgi:hydroxymethylpyrimidine pyrophosphatase-like HAD family hydrolase
MTARGGTKGAMVQRLAELLGVAAKDVYCIGDHSNDVSMAELSAVRFCPANAIDEMKALPGIRILSHCADGAIADLVELLDKKYQ